MGASPTQAGLVGSVYGGLQLFFSPIIGSWSDLTSRRHVLLWCILLAGCGYLTLGFSTTILLLAVARVPTGIFKHTQEIVRGYLADMVDEGEHSTVFGELNAASSIGFIIGPTLGGHIAEYPGGFHAAAFITTVIFLFNMGIVWWFVPEDFKRKHTSSQPVKKSSSSLLDNLRRISWYKLWDVFLVRFLMGFAVMIYRNNFVMMLDYKYEASAKISGYITSYSGLIGTLSGFFVGRIAAYYSNDAKLLLHAGVVQCLSIVSLTCSPSLWMLVVAMTPLSIANQVARVCSTNLTIHRGEGEDKGALLGVGASILALARMISPLVGGVAQEYHLAGPSLVGSVFAFVAVAFMAFIPGFTAGHKQKSS